MLTAEAEHHWREALRTLTPAEATSMMLRLQDPHYQARLHDLVTGTTYEADGADVLPLLHDDLVRRMDKSARQVGRGT